jgi:hypothetical protein
MARPTVVAWAACAVLSLAGSLTVGGVAAAKVREGMSVPGTGTADDRATAAKTVVQTLPAGAPGEQTALPAAVNAGAGGSITRADLDALVTAHSAALKGKNRAAFVGMADAKKPDLVKKVGQLYDNLQKVPFKSASYSVESVEGGESTFAQGAQATVTVDFGHQISGVDSAPVEERYRWTVVRGAGGLVVTDVGAPSERRGYPAPWDAVPSLTVVTRTHVVVMADDTSSGFAKSHADALEDDAEYDFAHWSGGGGTAPGFAVFLTSDRDMYQRIYDQGRDESVGVTVPARAASGDSYPSSRIAVDTTHYKNVDPADADIVFKHEMTHAMIDPLEDVNSRSAQEHLWVVEGFAEWESQRMYSPSELLYDGQTLHAYANKHGAPKALPTDTQVYSSDADTSSLGYFYSHMAMRYIADKYGPAKVDQFVLYVYQHAGGSTCVDDGMKSVLWVTTDQFTQGYAAWFRSSI